MKKLILNTVLFSCCAIAAVAQDVKSKVGAAPQGAMQAPPRPRRSMASPEMMAEKRSKMMQTQLGLNADQTKVAYQAELEFAQAYLASAANGSQPGEGQMNQMIITKNQKYKSVLTAEQYAKYETMMPKMPATLPPPPNR